MTMSTAPFFQPAPGPAQPYVLLVDDHAPSLERLRQVLEAAGYACVSTTSAPEALDYCETRPPTLVVTDLRMPRLDGPGLARWVQGRYPATPIVLVTGELLDGPALDQLCRTFAGVFTKPINIGPLLDLVGSFFPRED